MITGERMSEIVQHNMDNPLISADQIKITHSDRNSTYIPVEEIPMKTDTGWATGVIYINENNEKFCRNITEFYNFSEVNAHQY